MPKGQGLRRQKCVARLVREKRFQLKGKLETQKKKP